MLSQDSTLGIFHHFIDSPLQTLPRTRVANGKTQAVRAFRSISTIIPKRAFCNAKQRTFRFNISSFIEYVNFIHTFSVFVYVLAICSQIDIKMKLLWKLFHYFPFIECHVILSSIIILFNFIFFWAYFRSRVCLLNNSLHLTLFTLWCQAIAKKNATKNRIFDRNAMVLVVRFDSVDGLYANKLI